MACPRCQRVYFIIPQDKSFGPPIEVVELFGMPAATPNEIPSTSAPAA